MRLQKRICGFDCNSAAALCSLCWMTSRDRWLFVDSKSCRSVLSWWLSLSSDSHPLDSQAMLEMLASYHFLGCLDSPIQACYVFKRGLCLILIARKHAARFVLSDNFAGIAEEFFKSFHSDKL